MYSICTLAQLIEDVDNYTIGQSEQVPLCRHCVQIRCHWNSRIHLKVMFGHRDDTKYERRHGLAGSQLQASQNLQEGERSTFLLDVNTMDNF